LKRTVGLVVLTNIESLGGLVAILQVRGEFNNETMRPETWPGGCQVTVHGACNEAETQLETLLREAREEMGARFAQMIHQFHPVNEEGANFMMYAIPDVVKNVQLHGGSGGLRFIRPDQVDSIVNLKDFDRKTGVTDRRITAMFPDEKEAVRLAFEKFSKLAPSQLAP
jgi:hypothetical protein